jgi:ATP-binding protein involved in chromosome partitioning
VPSGSAPPAEEAVRSALLGVIDPELGDNVVDLGMVRGVDVRPDGRVIVEIALTVAGCPLRTQLRSDVESRVGGLPGVRSVEVAMSVMDADERGALMDRARRKAQEDRALSTDIPPTARVLAVSSGKGGVGKSSVTVNLAVALAAAGQKVGLLDADIYGHSIPRMLGVTGRPTQVEQMIMPPSAHGVKAISSGMLKKGNEPLPLRGPILHRLLQQFLADVYWGDLDVLLLDLPPGTGDVAISAAHLVPGSELIVVTTPQLASAEVAERAGSLAAQLHQRVVGVIENMAYLPCPHCGERVEVFGSGGGAAVAEALTRVTGALVPVLGEVPIDVRLRESGDSGIPLVLAHPDAPAALQLRKIADMLTSRSRSLAGRPLGLTPA